MILIYITCKDNAEAKKISKHLLDEKLIACVNIHPIESMYRWKGKIFEEQPESLMLIKTKKGKEEKIVGEIKKMHSHSVPCIEFIEVKKANKEYDEWVKSETK